MGDLTKNFSRWEFECKCEHKDCDKDVGVDYELIVVLQDVADYFEESVNISSGHRCVKHNKDVGGAVKTKKGFGSRHLGTGAADIQVSNVHPNKVHEYLVSRYPDKFGIGKYKTFTHIDTRRGKARWG